MDKKYTKTSYYKKTKCRNGNVDPTSADGVGYIAEVLVSKYLKIQTCFQLTNNFKYKGYDLPSQKKWGKIDSKGSTLQYQDEEYPYHIFHTRKNEKPNVFFCIGFDKDMKHVISVYIVPNAINIKKISRVAVPYNSKKSKYNKYRQDEKEWDTLFHLLKLEDCPVLKNKIGNFILIESLLKKCIEKYPNDMSLISLKKKYEDIHTLSEEQSIKLWEISNRS